MVSSAATKFGVRFLTRKERTVRRVTKYETRALVRRLEPPKPVRERAPPKPKAQKKASVPATLSKPAKPSRITNPRSQSQTSTSDNQTPKDLSTSQKKPKSTTSTTSESAHRTLQTPDLAKLARLNCSREFSLFHQFIKHELSRSYENQLAFLQTKLQHLKNEFVNKQAEHLNFEQIREYYNEAVQENIRRRIKPDEFLTLADKLKQDVRGAIDKWLRKKELKPQKQVTEFLQRRQARIRDRIKETLEEVKKQQQQPPPLDEQCEVQNESENQITISVSELNDNPEEVTLIENGDDEVMIID